MTPPPDRLTLQIVTASTRPSRKGPAVAAWADALARDHGAFAVEAVDLAEVGLPVFDEPEHPRLGHYAHAHTRGWGAAVARADAFLFVTPEYNHGPPPSLINALTYLSREWYGKPAATVSYGGLSAGLRAAELLKTTLTTLGVMPIPEGVALALFAQHLDAATGRFEPGDGSATAMRAALDALHRWARALAAMRAETL